MTSHVYTALTQLTSFQPHISCRDQFLLLVHCRDWKCGIDRNPFKINIYTTKYIYERTCASSTIVTKYLFALRTKSENNRKARTKPPKNTKNIYKLSGCAHRQIAQTK